MSDVPATGGAPSATPTEGQAPATETKTTKQLIDFGDEKVDLEQLKRDRNKWKGADKAFREAAKARETAEQFQRRLEEDPESVFAELPSLSAKKREFAEKWLLEDLEKTVGGPADPRDEELAQLKKDAAERKRADDEAKAKDGKAQYQKAVEARRESIAATLTKALESTPFHAHPELRAESLAEMAKYMRICKKAGHEPTAEELADHVKNQRMTSFRSLVASLEGEDLVNVLGEDLAKRLRKHDLEKLRKSRQHGAPQTAQTWENGQDKSKKREFTDPMSLRRR